MERENSLEYRGKLILQGMNLTSWKFAQRLEHLSGSIDRRDHCHLIRFFCTNYSTDGIFGCWSENITNAHFIQLLEGNTTFDHIYDM